MAGPIATAVQGVYNKKAAKKDREYAEQQQKAGLQLINDLDYEPMYASENVPTYQRSQSPVARSFLESFLMGNNPSSVSSTAPNARAKKQALQTQQNEMFGTPEQRLQQQRDYFAQTPWAVKTPTRKVNAGDEQRADAEWTVRNADYAGTGMNKSLADAYKDTGSADIEALQGDVKKLKHAGLDQEILVKLIGPKFLKEVYGGDADRMAADVRAAGGLEQLLKQKGWG